MSSMLEYKGYHATVEYDAEDDHNRAGDDTETKAQRISGHLCDTLYATEIFQDTLTNCPNAASVAGQSGRKGALQGNGQSIEAHWNRGEEADR